MVKYGARGDSHATTVEQLEREERKLVSSILARPSTLKYGKESLFGRKGVSPNALGLGSVKVEQLFRGIMDQFSYAKARFHSLRQNTAQLTTVFF